MPPVRNWRVGRVDQFAFWFRWSIYVLVVWALNAGRFRKHTRLKHSSADMLLYGSGSWRDVAQGARRSQQRAEWKIISLLGFEWRRRPARGQLLRMALSRLAMALAANDIPRSGWSPQLSSTHRGRPCRDIFPCPLPYKGPQLLPASPPRAAPCDFSFGVA